MSAFLVNDSHIDVLVQYGVNRRAYHGNNSYYWNGERHDMLDPQELGQKLLNENYRSLKSRYNDDDAAHEYRYVVPARSYKPEEIIGACDCLIYQSCESDDYYETEAYAIVTAIREVAIDRMIGDNRTWSITDANRKEERHHARLLYRLDNPDDPYFKLQRTYKLWNLSNKTMVADAKEYGNSDPYRRIRGENFWHVFNQVIADAVRDQAEVITIEWELKPTE